jgi:hypothetical protein
MATTVNQSPASYTPCYSPQWFEATSNNIAFTNFTFTIICTDVITSATATYNIEQRLDTKLVFDASNFAKNYIKHYVPNNVYGFQKCTDAIRKIRVNIGESYGIPMTYQVSGVNTEYIVWNGALNYLDVPAYSSTDYVYKTSTANLKYLTSDVYPTLAGYYTSNKITYSGKSAYLYCLSSENNDFQSIRISTYNAAGNFLNYSDIANPYAAGTTYTDKLVCIDIGHKGLSGIASGLVTGTYPIITAAVDSYVVSDNAITTISKYTIGCENRFTPYVLHYLDKSGNFETMNFSKVSETTIEADKTYFRKNPYTMTSNTWAYSNFTANETTLSSSTTTKIKLNSDWLTEDQANFYKFIISSPTVYLDMGATIGLIPVKVNTKQWLVNKKWNNRTFSISLDIEYTHKNIYQNG